MSLVRATFRVDAQLSAGVWISLRSDLSSGERFFWRRGKAGAGPKDLVAVTGVCEFGLRNDQFSGTAGRYSPLHANVRTGWTYGIPIRVVATYAGVDTVLWRGKLKTIDPMPGQYGPQRVRCVARDAMDDFAETDVRNIDLQIDQSEVTCLQQLIAAMPTSAQPPATSYDAALETFPYGLDNMSGGTRAMTGLVDIADSCQGHLYVQADGTCRYTNRHTWASTVSSFTFTDASLDQGTGIEVPSDQANVYNDVTATAHPKSPVSSIVLCGLTGVQYVEAGENIEIWLDYADPNSQDRLIAGRSFTTPLVSGTDYAGNSASDGSGSNQTANVSVSVSPFAASAKFIVSNTGTARIYLVNSSGTPLLQLRGTGIYDNGPETRRATSTQSYGVRRLEIDLKYQGSGAFANDVATFREAQYRSLANQVEQIAFDPQRSDALMTEALASEIGQVKTVSESMTGVSAISVIVQAIEMEVTKGDYLRVRYSTAPTAPFRSWLLGVAGSSELGVPTRLGF